MTLPSILKRCPEYRLSAIALPLVLLLALSGMTRANSFTEATNTLCSKIKSCTTAQLAQQQLPPAMMQMMTAMLDDTCTQTIAPYAKQATNAGLENAAIACIDSINTLSCDALLKSKGAETKECLTLENAANEAGIDTNIQPEDSGLK